MSKTESHRGSTEPFDVQHDGDAALADLNGRIRQLEAENAARRPNRMEPLPGWIARRRHLVPPAAEVVAQLPAGPIAQPPRPRQRVHV